MKSRQDHHKKKSKWILIQAKMLHKPDRILDLLCSKQLTTEYKNILTTSTQNNRLYWLRRGFKHGSEAFKDKADFMILHLPENYPLTHRDTREIRKLLNEWAERLGATAIINYHMN